MGYTPTQALYASLGYGAIQVVATIPTLFLIDTKGRRTLTLAVSANFVAIAVHRSNMRTIDIPWDVYFPFGSWLISTQPLR